MAEGTNVGGIYYTTTLDTQGLIDGRRRVEQELQKAGNAGDTLQARFRTLAAGIAGALAAIGVKSLVDKLVAVQREFDVMFAGLTTMTGGVDQASVAFERLESFAAKTPYTLQQSVDGFIKLKALGLDPSERAMTSFGNTASAMGKDLSQMIEAVADASTGEFERLKEFGIKAKTEGDKISFTFRGVRTTVANDANAITEYLVAMGETNFAGAMENRMKTLDGAISNLADSWDGLFRTVSRSGAGDVIANGVRMATEAISQAEASIKRGGLTEYFDALRPVIAAVEVAGISLAGAIAGKLLASMTAATTAMITKTLAARAAAVEALRVAQAELVAAAAADKVAQSMAAAGMAHTNLAASAARVAAAQTAVAAASAAASSKVTLAAGATRLFSGALAMMGGPIGLAITALGLLVMNWDKISGAAKNAADISQQSADRIRAAMSNTGGTPMKDLQAGLEESRAEMEKLDVQLKALGTTPGGATPFKQGLIDRREALRGAVIDTQKAIADLKAQQLDRALGGTPDAPQATPSDPSADAEKAAKNAKYLAELRAKVTTDGLAKIALAERTAMDDNAEALRKGEISAATSEQAKALIRQQFAADRKALVEKEMQDEAGARIAVTIDAESRVAAIRDEAIRRTNAAEKAGTLTEVAASRERALAVFDAERSMADLREKDTQAEAEMRVRIAASEQERIELSHAESIRRINAAEQAGTLSRVQAERERTLAAFDADRTRAELAERNTRARVGAEIAITRSASQQIMLIRDEEIRQAEEGYRRGAMTFEEAEASKARAVMDGLARQQQLQSTRSQTQISTLQIKAETTDDPRVKEELVRAQAAAQIEAVEQARLADLDASQIYADQKVAIEAKMDEDIRNLRANAAAAEMSRASSTFAGLAGIMKSAAGEQSGIYKAMFAASKAFAIAESIIKIQQGIASAAALPFPLNFPAMASVAAATTGIVQTITGTNYGGGRQYGGPVSADSMYRVNETGRPEMFTAANGNQFMLPTSSGRVTPADQVGAGGVQWQIIVNNTAPGAAASASVDNASRTVTIAVREVASQISERRGEVWGAMRTTNVQGRPG